MMRHGSAVRALAASFWATTAAPAFAATSASGADLSAAFWWRWGAALLLCLGLAGVGILLLRLKLQGKGGLGSVADAIVKVSQQWPSSRAAPRRLRVVEALRVSPQLEICIITCDGVEHLLAATPSAVTPLPPPRGQTGGVSNASA